MAKEYVVFQGKGKWCRLTIPDPKFNKWQLDLYFTAKSLDDFRALKVMNHLKKDEDGYFAKLSREVSKLMRGELVAFLPPKIFDKDGLPLEGVLIGNGSDLTVKCELRKYTDKITKEKKNAIRLESIRVDNLVPYEPKKDFDKDQEKAAEGLTDQPAPIF